jgi:glycosyltransferase involved in cell wall biosynthesis
MNSANMSLDAPRLSIITGTLNNREGLEKTLASVQAQQSAPAFEQIVVDGGSTDGSADVIRRLESRLAGWISEPDRGIYHAMNKGLDQATGDYLLFLNSGDRLANPRVLQTAFSGFPSADIVYGSIQVVRAGIPGKIVRGPAPENLHLTFWIQNTIQHSGTFIRRGLLTENRYAEDFRIVADRKFFFESFLAGKTFARIDHVITHFEMGGISSDPRHAALKRTEWDKLFTQHMSPLVLALLRREISSREKVDGALLGTHKTALRSTPALQDPVRRWIDLFFLLHRFAPTRALVQGFAWLARRWEQRRQRARRPAQ